MARVVRMSARRTSCMLSSISALHSAARMLSAEKSAMATAVPLYGRSMIAS